MDTELKLYENNQSVEGITEYMMLLNNPPKAESIKKNTLANNSNYISVGTIQSLLDTYYSGLWSIENFNYQVVANEIIGSLDLKVFHPAAKTWITRTGCGAVMIQTAKDKPATVEFKIKNTLTKDFPHLKAECLKNAAKSLGVVFGRNLNNSDDGVTETIIDIVENNQAAKYQAAKYRADLIQNAIDLIPFDSQTLKNQRQKRENQLQKATNEQLISYINRVNSEKNVTN